MTFVERFRAVVATAPSRVAVDDGAKQLTFAEVDARAMMIANHLRERGVETEDVVTIESDDRIAIMLGMLGVWYAGAAFCVITSDLPKERADVMRRAVHVVEALDDSILKGNPAEKNVYSARNPRDEDLAYVVFTSGTTGTPKGVLVTHSGIVPMLDAQIAAFELSPSARALWMLSPLFDASISDVLTSLLSGATLVPLNVRGLAPRDLAARFDANAITHADLPPSLLALLCDVLPKTLRTIVIGGEACAAHVVKRVAARVRLVNVYGPTEATVCTSLNVCHVHDDHGARIGTPLAHVTYRIEDDELLIAGSCLARGYAHDESLTSQRFVRRDGIRFYRTGDRVRARIDGELEMVGRIDRQAKIAGIRIEPEEIEARLREDENVIEAAVIAGERLEAFVVLRSGNVDDVRTRLEKCLPRFLVPSRIVSVDALPRGVTGKVVAHDLRRDDAISAIAHAFANALGREALGVDEDFLAAGADSLAILSACASADANGVIVSPETIAKERTARRVATSSAITGMTTSELARDVRSITRAVEPHAIAARSVFLTGARGTLGTALVRALVSRGASVTCLVRGDVSFGELPRVRTIRGDVARERFGLSRATWQALASEHDAIVHAAADLRLTSTYETLRDTNVLGACYAADFAAIGAPKTLHHISTLSVFASTDLARSGQTFEETKSLHSARIVHGGYAQSKWAAEEAVRGACVTRLGLLLPARGHDLFGAFVRAAKTLGCLPEGNSWRFDVTPVDFAANAIAHFVTADSSKRVRHVANVAPASMDDLANVLALERVPLDEFRDRAKTNRASLDALALASFRALSFEDDAARAFDLFEATDVALGATQTLEDLKRANITCGSAIEVLLECLK